jgi:hypothetical protein
LGNSFVEVSLVSGAVWESHEAFSIEVEGHVRDAINTLLGCLFYLLFV